MEQFEVSAITAKRAITELEQKGLVYRRRGAGSFVKRQEEELTEKNTANRICAAVLPFGVSQQHDFSLVTQTINSVLTPHNCFVSVYNSDRSRWKEEDALENLSKQNISWLLYYPNTNSLHLDILNRFVMKDVPVVVLDKRVSAPLLNNVVCDNFNGAHMLTNYLISIGHKKIAYLCSSGVEKLSSVNDRLNGYMYALKKSGIKIDSQNIVTRLEDDIEEDRPIPSKEQIKCIKMTILDFVKRGVTAVECEHDGIAAQVIECCAELGLDVPGSLSVCGFDGLSPSNPRHESSGITTVYQNFEIIAQEVSDILLSTLDGAPCIGKKVQVPVVLQINKSTAPLDNGFAI